VKFAPTFSAMDDSEDTGLMPHMTANEIAPDIGVAYRGGARFRSLSKMITMYRRLTRSFDDRKMHLHLRILPDSVQALTGDPSTVATSRVSDLRPA
jgi:hypothetical protein